MPDDPRVEQLLNQLLDSHATPEEVCDSCVELLPVVRTRWQQVRRARAELDALFPPALEPGTSLPAFRSEDTHLPVVLGYEVETVLGVGGMGVVFRARHLGLNRVVALKMALAGGYAGPDERACLQREAQAVAALRHANVVQVHDVGESEGRPYFTMEYVEGGSLAQKLAGTPLPAGEAGGLVATLAAAVHAAHRAGIVHRDLKPANVLLTSDGVPKVSDFGLARRFVGEAGLSRTGTAVGTPSYMAPEQARGQADAVGPAADVYALGAILYEVLTGRPPFRAETAAETVRQLLDQDPVPPSRLNGKVPRDVETICLKCLHKEPRLRYATAAALADDLGRFLRGESIAARPEGRLARLARRVRRRPLFSAAVSAVTLVTVILMSGGLWLLTERDAASRAAAADRAATERAAGDDLADMETALRKSSWSAARTALERARGRLGDRGSADLLLRLETGSSDLEFAAQMDRIRMRAASTVGGVLKFAQADADYEKAFQDFGLGSVHEAPAVVAARISGSNIRGVLVATLDDWAVRTGVATRRQWASAVAQQADEYPSAWRSHARDPATFASKAAIAEAIANAPVAEESIPLLLSFTTALDAAGTDPVPLLRRIRDAYPRDFWVSLTLGDMLYKADNNVEAIRYYQVAQALRPDTAIVYINLGVALKDAGRPADAIDQYYQALKIDPTSSPVHSNLSLALLQLRHYDEAIDHIKLGLSQRFMVPILQSAWGDCLVAKGRPAEAIEHYRLAVALDPKMNGTQTSLWGLLIRQGRLVEAQAAWGSAIESNPCHEESYDGYAEICLFLGQNDEYRRASKVMLDHFGATAETQQAERIGRACLLAPLPAEEMGRAAALIDRALAGTKQSPVWIRPYYLFAKGLAEYRLGHYEQAIALVGGEASRVLGPAPGLVLALAQHRRGQVAEARTTLARAVVSHDWRASEANSREKWIYHILRREAESLILPELPAFLEGKHEPRDNDERLALLGICQFTGRSLAEARLCADAFAADPLLGDDLHAGLRYRAARAAALTGNGRGADATRFTEPEQVRWRSQARTWLRADLVAWGKSLDRDPAAARNRARQQLTQWLNDPDLTELREPAELGKLPAEERKDCVALWAELDVLLARLRIAK